MIPRFKPYLGKEELLALLQQQRDKVPRFEEMFACTFEADHAIAFSYGRSALWAFFKALNIENAEIILPAYTCSVVAHAIVLSGNIPRFVDICLYDYNMNLDQLETVINEKTRAIIATHLFGYPLNVDRLNKIVREREALYGQKIWIIHDCAHSFGADWQGKLVCHEKDAALFGLGIGKIITSILGGMLTTNNSTLAHRLRIWRDTHFNPAGFVKSSYRRSYLLAVYMTFFERFYGLVHWIEEETPLLDRLTKAYHLDEKIHFPPDYLDNMLNVEAQVGLIQLQKYSKIIQRRREQAHYYQQQLPNISDWVFPPLVDGATYAYYVIRVPDRADVLLTFRKRGVQLGTLIQYSLPYLAPYRQYVNGQEFPNSLLCSQQMINLPMYPTMSKGQQDKVVNLLRSYARDKLES